MEDLVGPYKWGQHLTLVILPSHKGNAGGMENPNMITIAPYTLLDKKMAEGVLIHETAHQWFGNTITYQNFQHVWISEGFTAYLSSLVIGKMYGESYQQYVLSNAKWDKNQSIVTNRAGKLK